MAATGPSAETRSSDNGEMQTPARILIVDDERPLAMILARGLTYAGYETSVAHSGLEALDHLAERRFELLLTDINMPKMRGDELQQFAREIDPDLAVLLMTAAHDTKSAVACLNAGVFDYLLKPFDLVDVEVRVASALLRRRQMQEDRDRQLAMQRRLQEQAERLHEATRGAQEALMVALAAKDRNTFAHSCRVEQLAGLLAARICPGEEHFGASVRLAARFHDIGKIGVRDALLNKIGSLTEEEAVEMQQHVAIGDAILRPVLDTEVLAMVRCHHEQVAGGGYPDGRLAGEAIPLGGRVIAVADAYDAMASPRPYHRQMEPAAVLAYLRDGAGTHWDADIVDALHDLAAEGALTADTPEEEEAALAVGAA